MDMFWGSGFMGSFFVEVLQNLWVLRGQNDILRLKNAHKTLERRTSN